MKKFEEMRYTDMIDRITYENWKDQIILHDEDDWGGKYKTYGEMWKGEGYGIEGMSDPADPTKLECFKKCLELEHLAERPTYDGRNYVEQSEGAFVILSLLGWDKEYIAWSYGR